MPLEKVLAFLKSLPCSKKLKNNRFRVPIQFATIRFSFEKFLPPPPLLHPIIKDSNPKADIFLKNHPDMILHLGWAHKRPSLLGYATRERERIGSLVKEVCAYRRL